MGRSTSFPDLDDVLRASRDTEPEELRAAYHERARELHPDISDDHSVLSQPRSRLLEDRLAPHENRLVRYLAAAALLVDRLPRRDPARLSQSPPA